MMVGAAYVTGRLVRVDGVDQFCVFLNVTMWCGGRGDKHFNHAANWPWALDSMKRTLSKNNENLAILRSFNWPFIAVSMKLNFCFVGTSTVKHSERAK